LLFIDLFKNVIASIFKSGTSKKGHETLLKQLKGSPYMNQQNPVQG